MIKNYLILGINPEPWEASEGSVGRKNDHLIVQMHKTRQSRNYREAIEEEFKIEWDKDPFTVEGDVVLKFYLWREIAQRDLLGHTSSDHVADATNMQKALEDAMQGFLFENDRNVRDVQTVIMAQGPDVVPRILIVVSDEFKPPAAVRRLVDGLMAERHVDTGPIGAANRRQIDDIF